ncbi:TonB-dependent receptor [soil metagenome]
MIFTILCKKLRTIQFAKSKTILVMKLTAILLLACCLQVAATGYSQNVTLALNNAPLKKVFVEIKKQTGYVFFYNARLLEKANSVSISAKDISLEMALDLCFKLQPLTYTIVNKTIVISAKKVEEQPVIIKDSVPDLLEVKGKVIDEGTKKTIIGANVFEKATGNGVATDSKGEFTIKVKPGAILTISYVGYENKQLTVKDNRFVSVQLLLNASKDPMDNVVITGYQAIKSESFTGSSITVTGEELKKRNPQNLLLSLQSFDPSFRVIDNNLLGSNPNRLPSIAVRGATALPGGSTDAISRTNLAGNVNLPTFILDGYEVSLQKIYDLDLNRVKSVTLLKDAAATAVYGSRAANGVLVIVTNPPKSGQLQLSYNYELQVSAADLSEYHVLDATQKLDYEYLARLYDPNYNQALSQDQLDAYYYHKKELVAAGVNTYWLSQPLRTAFGQKHSIYIEGGENAIRYGLGLRYQTMPGVMQGSTRDRYSTDLSLSYSPGSKFQFKNTVSITMMKSKESPYGNFSDYVRANPYYPKADSAGHIIQEIDRWTDRRYGGVGSYPILNPMYNATLGSFDKSDYIELIDAVSTEWNITNALRLKGVISLNQTKSTSDRFVSPFANTYYESTDLAVGKRGRYDYGNRDETTVDGTLSLTYNKQVGEHFLNVLMAANMRSYLSKYKSIAATGFTNDRFTDIGFASSYAKNSTPYSDQQEERLVGALLSLNYSYKNKYLLDYTFREDGSSKFGSDKRVAPFTAVGIGWNLHKEAFLQNSAISRLKLKASTGLTGSVSFSPYMSQTTYSYDAANQYSTGIGAIVNNYGNNRLEWQKTRSTDIGMELGLFKDRVVIAPRYYRKLTHGLVADVSLAPSIGFSSYKENVGDMRNEGFEINMQANLIRSKNWNLNMYANFVRNTNTIISVSNSLKAYNDKVDQAQDSSGYKGAPLVRYKEGQSLDAIYAVRSLGIDPENGRELYVKKDGTLTYVWDVRDIVPVGVSTPKGEVYFGTNANYKRLSLSLTCYARFGGQKYNQTLVDRVENADPHYNVDIRVFEDKWKNRGDLTFYKNIADLGSTDVSSRFVQKDNVLALQSIYFSYDIDVKNSFFSRINAKSFRAAFVMNEAWRWSSIKEERGIDYPYARSFTISLQAGF